MQLPKILLHTCCAPCFAYVHEMLVPVYAVTSYFYNPNIDPPDEYERRLGELSSYAVTASFPLIIEDPDRKEWVREIKPHRFMGERSVRCDRCFRFRLEKAFARAKREDFAVVGTVLSISPHKDAGAINRIGTNLERTYGIEFLAADFKKNDGFRRSVELSREMGFYRQDYCGCIYSKMERRKSMYGKNGLYRGFVNRGA